MAGGQAPVANCQPLMSLAAKHRKLQPMVLLPFETGKVASDNSIITSLTLCNESSVKPFSTDNPSDWQSKVEA